MEKKIVNKLIVFLLILIAVILSVYIIIRLNIIKIGTVDRIMRDERKTGYSKDLNK